MLNVLLVDDESNARDNLRAFLKRLETDVETNIVGEASNITEARELIEAQNPDVVFLDIEMPGGNGFDLLSKFNQVQFEVIFVTAYGHYAIKAIKFSALGYILKPINISDLKEALLRVKEKIDHANASAEPSHSLSNLDPSILSQLVETLKKADPPQKLFIPETNGFTVVKVDEILYCKADGNYTEIITLSGKHVCSKSLKEFQELLELNGFYRINKSHIINPNFIRKYVKGSGGYVIMQDNSEIDVPRRSKDEFLQFIGIH